MIEINPFPLNGKSRDILFAALLFASSLVLFLPISPSITYDDGLQVFVGYGISSSLIRVVFTKELDLILPIIALSSYLMFDLCILLNRLNKRPLTNKIIKVLCVIAFITLFFLILLSDYIVSWIYYLPFVIYCFILTVFSIFVTVIDKGSVMSNGPNKAALLKKPGSIRDACFGVFTALIVCNLLFSIFNKPMLHLYHALVPLVIFLLVAIGLLLYRVIQGSYHPITLSCMYLISFIGLPITHCYNANTYEVSANIFLLIIPILEILCSLLFASLKEDSSLMTGSISSLSAINLLAAFLMLFMPINSYYDVPSRIVDSISINASVSSFPILTIFEWESRLFFNAFPVCSFIILIYFLLSLAVTLFEKDLGQRISCILKSMYGFVSAILCILINAFDNCGYNIPYLIISLLVIEFFSVSFALKAYKHLHIAYISNPIFGNVLYLLSIPVYLLGEVLLVWKMSVFALITAPVFVLSGVFSNLVFSSKNKKNVFFSLLISTVGCVVNFSIYFIFVDSISDILLIVPSIALFVLTVIASFYINTNIPESEMLDELPFTISK